MRIGLQAIGIGAGARPDVLRAVARAAEAAGFATLWAGEHVVLFDEHGASKYPYAADGRFSVPSGEDWLDPFAALAWAVPRRRRSVSRPASAWCPSTTR